MSEIRNPLSGGYKTKKLISNFNLLSIICDNKLECTSSWFAWSENIPTCIGCDYCIIRQIEYLDIKKVKIGVHPKLLNELEFKIDIIDFSSFSNNKISKYQIQTGQISYNDLRTVKPCIN